MREEEEECVSVDCVRRDDASWIEKQYGATNYIMLEFQDQLHALSDTILKL